MKAMNQEAKDSLNDVAEKLMKEAITKKKQSEELLLAAKILEDTANRVLKEIGSINVEAFNKD